MQKKKPLVDEVEVKKKVKEGSRRKSSLQHKKRGRPSIHMKDMTQKQKDEFHSMLVKGASCKDVALHMKEVMKVLTGSTAKNIKNFLENYKRQNIDPALIQKNKNLTGDEKKVYMKKLDEKVDVLVGMGRVLNIQMERIERAVKLEKPTSFVLSGIRQEILAYKELMVDYAKLQMMMGTIRRDDGQYISPLALTDAEEITRESTKIFKQVQQSSSAIKGFLKEVSINKLKPITDV